MFSIVCKNQLSDQYIILYTNSCVLRLRVQFLKILCRWIVHWYFDFCFIDKYTMEVLKTIDYLVQSLLPVIVESLLLYLLLYDSSKILRKPKRSPLLFCEEFRRVQLIPEIGLQNFDYLTVNAHLLRGRENYTNTSKSSEILAKAGSVF